ncbi:MAG: FlgO family outer membrane protein [bacterium]
MKNTPIFLVFLFLVTSFFLPCLTGCAHRQLPDTAGKQVTNTPASASTPKSPPPSSAAIRRVKETAPSWVVSRKDIRYPYAFYLTGVGVSDKDSTSADEDARMDLLKQIEMEISGEETSFQGETSLQQEAKGIHGQHHSTSLESRVESKIKVKIDTKIAGLTISERWYSEQERRYYSLATLERDTAAGALEGEIISSLETIHNLYSSGLGQENNRELVKALDSYRQANAMADSFHVLLKQRSIIRKDKSDLKSQELEARIQDGEKSLADSKRRLDNIISNIRIFPVDGNNQKGFAGSPLARDLAVKVLFEGQEGDRKNQYPIAGMPVKFAFDSSTGELDAGVITDANGIARSKVYRVDQSKNRVNTISAVVNLEDGGQGSGKKATFTYDLLIADMAREPEAYPWSEGIVKLVEEVIARIYTNATTAGAAASSSSSKVAVLDFSEARSEERLILSRVLESDLRTTLAKVDGFVVIDEEGSPDKARDRDLREKARALKADYYLSGVYWLYDQGLRINAKLVDTDDGTLVSTARIIIARDSIDSADLKSLDSKSGHSQNQDTAPAYDLTLDKVYFSEEEERKFSIDLWTDRSDYKTGDSLTLYVKSDRDCYLSLLDIGTSGKLTVIFPNPLQKDNFIRGGRTYSIPSPEFGGVNITVSGPAGIERIKAIASIEPFALVDPAAFCSLEKENTRGLRDLSIGMQNLSSLTWVQDFTEIRIHEN